MSHILSPRTSSMSPHYYNEAGKCGLLCAREERRTGYVLAPAMSATDLKSEVSSLLVKRKKKKQGGRKWVESIGESHRKMDERPKNDPKEK